MPDDLACRVIERQPAAVAAALSRVEDRRPAARDEAERLLARLAADGRGATAHVVGLTGAPGVGKSTLAGALVKAYRRRDVTVAVVAVDPSSPVSGGALLGDRARIEPEPDDRGTFVRSLASRGELGGLAREAPDVVAVLSAAFDVVLVETVGVGQSEVEISQLADTVVLVVQPGAGDTLQFLKAGVMEIPDLLVLGKSDMPGAARTAGELRGATRLALLDVCARSGRGVDALADALAERHRTALADGTLLSRRRDRTATRVAGSVARRIGEDRVRASGGVAAIRARVEELLAGGVAAAEAERRLADALR